MSRIAFFVGLDVHKDTIWIAVARSGNEPPQPLGEIPHDVPKLIKRLERLGKRERIHCAYEAGPTGYGLCRRLRAEGFACDVIAPSKTPCPVGDRVKTDRRDAELLARFLRSGDLSIVDVPTEGMEALRDLVRCRADAAKALLSARHHMSKFLLRRGRVWKDGRCHWTHKHMEWLRSQEFELEAHRLVFNDYLAEIQHLVDRVHDLEVRLADLATRCERAEMVRALQAVRGIQLLAATTLVAELGDLRRFPSPKKLMGYLGVVPSEYSSGSHVHRGRITKTGNGHVRRLLVEAAWAYRHKPNISRHLKKRAEGVAPEVQRIAWRAQKRLHHRYWSMTARGKSPPRTIVAMARELAGFIWHIGQQDVLIATSG